MWWIKLIVVVLLVAAVVALFRGLISLVREGSGGRRTMRALAWRVGFSAAVFAFLMVSMYMGWIQPHGLAPEQARDPDIEAKNSAN
jgi:NADH:ubiquinone oxidoreductase subunit 6 (subunit J)